MGKADNGQNSNNWVQSDQWSWLFGDECCSVSSQMTT